jgi:hypothetical protein
MDTPYGFVNGTNPCFSFYLRYMDCTNNESFYKLMCKHQQEDYNECLNHKRFVFLLLKKNSFTTWYETERKKVKILSIPRYNDQTDSFDDGPLPESVDSFFKNDDKFKQFFNTQNK